MLVIAERIAVAWESLAARRSRLAAAPPAGAPVAAPAAVAVAAAVAFVSVQPGVGDLWAARARQYAAAHGVGLTYWFGWFAGGAPPGSYSVLTPFLSALLGVAVLGALATVAITPLTWLLLRGTQHPVAGTWIATVAAGFNLWSGRIPFAVGSAFAVAALLAVRARRWVLGALLAVLAALASPVSGALLVFMLAGAVLTVRSHRLVAAITLLSAGLTLLVIYLLFGSPGTERYDALQALVAVVVLGLFLLARPPKPLRVLIAASLLAVLVLTLVPNGLGANFQRLIWIALPAAVVATSPRGVRTALLATAAAIYAAAQVTVNDLQVAAHPVASAAYYAPLAAQMDTLPGREDYRLEVVDDGTHTAAYALLGHATLARGYETQADNAFDAALNAPALTSDTYRAWLDANAVGYVAISSQALYQTRERELVSHGLSYLTPIWHTADWTLLRVRDATPIVSAPARVVDADQASLTIDIPQPGMTTVHVHWSRYLVADGTAAATLRRTPTGWTSLTTTRAGTYTLRALP